MSTLSVFVDESGDFGPYDHHSPYFMLSMVFHDQSASIEREIPFLERALERNGFAPGHAVHTAPLIRRELEYRDVDPEVRRRLFDALFNLYIHCDVATKTIAVPKREFGDGQNLAERIARDLGLFLRAQLAWLQSFDHVIVYYDKGQSEVTRTLRLIFSANLADVEFRVVHPDECRLLQVADLVCTLELLEAKLGRKALGRSETEFFQSGSRLRKNYLKWLDRKRIR